MNFLKNKIIKKVIIVGVIIFGCILAWALIYYNATKPPYSPADLPQPYLSMVDYCLVSDNLVNPYDNCCLASLRASMRPEVDVSTIVPFNRQASDCSDGFFLNGYKCPMSFMWCEKVNQL
jgi:hypothetical protein